MDVFLPTFSQQLLPSLLSVILIANLDLFDFQLSAFFNIPSFIMKLFAILSAVSAVSATLAVILPRQSLTFPSCAESCIANADIGSCDPSDDTCLCNTPSFVSSTAACISSSCTGNDLTQADEAAEQLCLAVGVTLSSTAVSSTSAHASSSSSSSSSTAGAASATSSSNGALSPAMNTFVVALGVVAAVVL